MEAVVSEARVHLRDYGPKTDSFLEEVLAGLRATPKAIPSKFFYDARGSALFDEICELEAYYPTRTELAIMHRHVDEMVACIGPNVLLVEYGSGSSIKTRILLDHLEDVAGYVPIDISRSHLIQSAARLAERYEALEIYPVCADYTQAFTLPREEHPGARPVVFFPGSTIGNFTIGEASDFLRRIGRVCGKNGGLLIGVDLKKDRAVLHEAYNDPQGVTAAFNKNLLVRINHELEGTFNVDRFAHEAVYNEAAGRIEMYLVSLRRQDVSVATHVFTFEEGERVLTEYSHKFSLDDFAALADDAGFDVERVWVDDRRYFSVQYLVAR